MKNSKVRVTITEHDSWSGPKDLETKEFDSIDEARVFCKSYNARNTAPTAPEYYTEAHIG